jgi:hypothetical protein
MPFFLLNLFFNPDVGGYAFFRNVDSLSTDYIALYVRRITLLKPNLTNNLDDLIENLETGLQLNTRSYLLSAAVIQLYHSNSYVLANLSRISFRNKNMHVSKYL